MQRVPRMLRRLLPPWRSATPSILPTSRSHPIRLTTSSSAGFRSYAPLRNSSPSPGSPLEPPPNATLTVRLKHIIKSYGWYALGVYVTLSTIDFGIAFALVNFFGAEQVGRLTAYVKAHILEILGREPAPVEPGKEAPTGTGSESLYAMVVLAYTVHKTIFLPFRAGLTIALTPRIVRWLHARGWAGGAGTLRAVGHMKDKLRKGNKIERD
jgi:hypothetical protein